MCEQCCAKTVMYSENDMILDTWFLVRATQNGNVMKEGEWGLVESNDPSFTFKTTPTPSPYYFLSEKESDALPKEDLDNVIDWEDKARDFGNELLTSAESLQGLARLVLVAQKHGWSPEEHPDPELNKNYVGSGLCYFLFQKIGEFLMTHPEPVATDPVTAAPAKEGV